MGPATGPRSGVQPATHQRRRQARRPPPPPVDAPEPEVVTLLVTALIRAATSSDAPRQHVQDRNAGHTSRRAGTPCRRTRFSNDVERRMVSAETTHDHRCEAVCGREPRGTRGADCEDGIVDLLALVATVAGAVSAIGVPIAWLQLRTERAQLRTERAHQRAHATEHVDPLVAGLSDLAVFAPSSRYRGFDTDVIDRRAESAMLLRQVRAGRSVITIEGAMGIGKTTLAAHLCRRVHDRDIRWVFCDEKDGTFTLTVLAKALARIDPPKAVPFASRCAASPRGHLGSCRRRDRLPGRPPHAAGARQLPCGHRPGRARPAQPAGTHQDDIVGDPDQPDPRHRTTRAAAGDPDRDRRPVNCRHPAAACPSWCVVVDAGRPARLAVRQQRQPARAGPVRWSGQDDRRTGGAHGPPARFG